MLIILTTNITTRLSYTAKQIFENILAIPYHLIEQRNYNPIPNGNVVYYGTESTDFANSIYYSGLCHEEGVKEFKPKLHLRNDKPVYFDNEKALNQYPVDIFSLAFYFLSRYEEYNQSQKDNHGRFKSSESIAGVHEHLEFPIVDYWVRDFASFLKNAFKQLEIPDPVCKFIPTFDIDHAWKYRNKGFIRNSGGLIKDLVKLSIKSTIDRIKVLSGISHDPYFTFKEIKEVHKDLDVLYFILIAHYSKKDINIEASNKAFIQLLKDLSLNSETGIHPSYASNKKADLLYDEIEKLQSITGKKPTKSRQHFLKLSFPGTYQNLIRAGITDDYTMGFASSIGFRAGTAYAFDWYNLSTENCTSLKIWPFIAMDITLRNYMRLRPKDAFNRLELIHQQLKLTGGNLITIWHNSSFCETEGWKKWVQAYKDFVNNMKS